MSRKLILGFLFFIPTLVFAVGFPKEAIFLSKDPVVAGETVLIHTIVSNTSTSTFTGKLTFLDGKIELGTDNISILPANTQTATVSWKPGVGSHTIVANLFDSKSNLTDEHTLVVVVNATNTETVLTDTQNLQDSKSVDILVSTISPSVAKGLIPMFNAIDAFRAYSLDQINKGIAWTNSYGSKQTSISGKLFPTETTNVKYSPSEILNQAMMWISFLAMYVLKIIKFCLLQNILFYPVTIILLLLLLWRILGVIRDR